jgi:hypothetical protein
MPNERFMRHYYGASGYVAPAQKGARMDNEAPTTPLSKYALVNRRHDAKILQHLAGADLGLLVTYESGGFMVQSASGTVLFPAAPYSVVRGFILGYLAGTKHAPAAP